jgi:hypothetical protein
MKFPRKAIGRLMVRKGIKDSRICSLANEQTKVIVAVPKGFQPYV